MSKLYPILAGQTFDVPYPFVVKSNEDDERWVPGTRERQCAPDDFDLVADSMGSMLITVVDVASPTGFRDRVFYLRKWRSPDGDVFGRHVLRCMAINGFRNLLKGYRHSFEVLDDSVEAAA